MREADYGVLPESVHVSVSSATCVKSDIAIRNLQYYAHEMLRPQDPLVLLKLTLLPSGWRQLDVAQALGISQTEVHSGLKRAAASKLYKTEERTANKTNLVEFLIHGLKYMIPAELGPSSRGIPTAWSGPPLGKKIVSGAEDTVVWPYGDGAARGNSLLPIYETVPLAALKDHALYELLVLVDAIRIGRARERAIAEDELARRLL